MQTGKRIIVLGCPGSGKSTFARKLQEINGLPLFHLDNIWWKADRSHISRAEFDERLEEVIAGEEWIIDGDYSRTYERRIRACDTIFFLDYDKDVCIEGIIQRTGSRRVDIPWIEDQTDPELLLEVENYQHSNRRELLELFKKYPDKQLIIFKKRQEADKWLDDHRNERPVLDKDLDANTFKEYYWLKEELLSFCRENCLPVSGNKETLNQRIIVYLDHGETDSLKTETRKRTIINKEITADDLIEENIVCSQKHRAFFKEKIGPAFTFNVAFQQWLKNNAGKTYGQAIQAYHELKKNRNKDKEISRQFEYNTYIRDFFRHNKGYTLNEAIRCWNYKKTQKGSHRYEDRDLLVLQDKNS